MTTSSKTSGSPDLSSLARPSGGFAMVAIDQREALRAMFAERQRETVTDAQLTEFKLAAARALSPHASGLLVDRQFAFDRIVAENAVAPECGLIAAADLFIGDEREIVADTEIDAQVVPERVAEQGAVAMKLLVIYRPDGNPARRIAMVEEFVDRCHAAGLLAILEPVARAPRDGRQWDWDASVLAAASELGSRGVDLYKAEVPLHGEGDSAQISRRCAELGHRISSPWVVLSSGVPHDTFPTAVDLACREGASGFLAGRAVWAPALDRVAGAGVSGEDVERHLREISVPRLQLLCDVVDAAVRDVQPENPER